MMPRFVRPATPCPTRLLAAVFLLPMLLLTACETIYEGSDEQKRDEGLLPPLSQTSNTTVYFKNGTTIEGTLISLAPDSAVTIQRADGQIFTYLMDGIKRIEKSQRSPDVPLPPTTLEISGLVGHGFVDGYNTGLGMRLGAMFPSGLYFGGTFVHHFGVTERVLSLDVNGNMFYTGLELGGTIRAAPTTIFRPYVGGGIANYMGTVRSLSTVVSSASRTEVYSTVGAELKQALGQLTLGVDARGLSAPNLRDTSTLALFFTIGFRP